MTLALGPVLIWGGGGVEIDLRVPGGAEPHLTDNSV